MRAGARGWRLAVVFAACIVLTEARKKKKTKAEKSARESQPARELACSLRRCVRR